jgi:fibronectin-binding autotransporter adhesin
LQYTTALQITNPSAGTPAAPYDISSGGGITIPTNGATLTVQAPITGTGKLTKTQAGTVSLANALTRNPTANAYRYSGGTSIAEGTVISLEGSGTPIGTGAVQMVGSTLSLQPSAMGAPVSPSLANDVGATLNFGPGSILELNRGSNTSLSVAIGGATNLPNLASAANGTLVIKPSDGVSGLGTSTIVKVNGTGSNLPPVTNTIVSPKMVVVNTNSAGQFLTYRPAANGFGVASYISGNLVSAGANAVYAALTPQILNTNATIYALKLENVGIQGLNGTQTLSIGRGVANEASGIIFNGGSITNLKLAFGAAQAAIFASQAGGTIGAGISGTAGLLKFGPGNLTLSGRSSYSGATVVASGKLTINSGSNSGIGSVSVYSGATLTGNGAIFGNLTLNSGAIRNGAGMISGNVEIESGATFSGGGVVYGSTVVNGFLTPIGIAGGTVFNGEVTVGQNGILVWNLNRLVDSSTPGAVPGIDFSYFRTVGVLDLGASGGLLLQFAPGLSPDKSLTFWTKPHTWTIARSDQPIGWISQFGGLFEPLYKDGHFSWNNVQLAGGGYALQLYYYPYPSP